LELLEKDGKLPVYRGFVNEKQPMSKSIDAPLWFFKRIKDLRQHFNQADLKRIKQILKQYLLNLPLKDSLLYTESSETWMDTINRSGHRLEIQVLLLNAYDLMFKLSRDSSDKGLRDRFKETVKKIFWQDGILIDEVGDFTVRPNIFLAYYIYPELLTKQEWRICFQNALEKLWLSWGGLASIAKDDVRFQSEHTGENNLSYHSGDSWFYLNNIAAICLYQVDKKRFADYIRKIIAASTTDILEDGILGAASELSDADKLSARGCLNQAWSNASYLEMIDEIFC
jgi:glycogen debranching enzyme